MADASDVVVVGGGIGGASLAFALARAGVDVSVLEASTEFADRVRGESMQTWGVKEARDIGVEQVLLDAGAHITPVWKQYMEGAGDVGDIPMAMMVPDIPGIAEPSPSGRVSGAARRRDRRGCDGRARRARRSARGRKLADGDVRHERPGDRAADDARRRRGRARVDGAEASRHHAWIVRSRSSYIAGLLVDGLDGVPDDHDVVAGEGDVFFLVFHQGGGRAPRVPVHGLVRTTSLLGSDRNRAVPRRVQRLVLPVE